VTIDNDFVALIRSGPVSDDELKTSLLSAGWDANLPAIRDENGVLLVGNRRMAIALSNNIRPVERVETFGAGPEADAARARLAWLSNVGWSGVTAADRKRVAERLYRDGMTQAAIAAVMGVSQGTVSNDLSELLTANNSPRVSARGRVNEGRPRSRPAASGEATDRPEPDRPARQPRRPLAERPRAETAPTAIERERRAAELLDRGLTPPEIAADLGDEVQRYTDQTIEHVRIYREGVAAGRAEAAANPAALSGTAQERLAAAMRQQERRLAAEFEARVQTEVRNRLSVVLPGLRDRERQARHVMERRRGIMPRTDYDLVLRCIHPDSRLSASDEMLARAFRVWNDIRLLVLNEDEHPTPTLGMPNSVDELMVMRQRVQEERRARARRRRATA
jgi:DNA-binding CsgD family transcriptional regulator